MSNTVVCACRSVAPSEGALACLAVPYAATQRQTGHDTATTMVRPFENSTGNMQRYLLAPDQHVQFATNSRAQKQRTSCAHKRRTGVRRTGAKRSTYAQMYFGDCACTSGGDSSTARTAAAAAAAHTDNGIAALLIGVLSTGRHHTTLRTSSMHTVTSSIRGFPSWTHVGTLRMRM